MCGTSPARYNIMNFVDVEDVEDVVDSVDFVCQAGAGLLRFPLVHPLYRN